MRNKTKNSGFTLIELMIVVAILAVLAAVAVVAFGKWTIAAKESEAKSVLADIKIKQEAYRATFRQYATGGWAPSNAKPDKKPLKWSTTATPAANTAWRQLGIIPGNNDFYFRYFIDAGSPGATPDARFGGMNIGQTSDYWYGVQAIHDLDDDGTCEGFEIYGASEKIHTPKSMDCP